MKKLEFEYPDETLLAALLELLYTYDPHAGIEIIDFLIKCSFKEVRVSIETLMEEIKAVASEKSEFENRDKSKLIAFSGNSG